MVTGRPIEYTAEFIENEARELKKWMEHPNHIFYGEFAALRGYSEKRLSEWEKQNAEFSEAIDICRSIQKHKLLNKGLYGEIKEGLTKFCLINNHGYKNDKSEESDKPSSNVIVIDLNEINGKTKDLVQDR